MNPAVLVAVLGPAARDVGLDEQYARLVGLGDDVSLVDVLDLIEAMEKRVALAIGRDLPTPTSRAMAARILELAEAGLRDPEIAQTIGISVEAVRFARRRAGVRGTPKPRERSGWEDRLRELDARGMSRRQIAEETGWSDRTVRDRLSRLGLARGG